VIVRYFPGRVVTPATFPGGPTTAQPGEVGHGRIPPLLHPLPRRHGRICDDSSSPAQRWSGCRPAYAGSGDVRIRRWRVRKGRDGLPPSHPRRLGGSGRRMSRGCGGGDDESMDGRGGVGMGWTSGGGGGAGMGGGARASERQRSLICAGREGAPLLPARPSSSTSTPTTRARLFFFDADADGARGGAPGAPCGSASLSLDFALSPLRPTQPLVSLLPFSPQARWRLG
jgi:hypothetical protein